VNIICLKIQEDQNVKAHEREKLSRSKTWNLLFIVAYTSGQHCEHVARRLNIGDRNYVPIFVMLQLHFRSMLCVLFNALIK
jgi:hypothetical protein